MNCTLLKLNVYLLATLLPILGAASGFAQSAPSVAETGFLSNSIPKNALIQTQATSNFASQDKVRYAGMIPFLMAGSKTLGLIGMAVDMALNSRGDIAPSVLRERSAANQAYFDRVWSGYTLSDGLMKSAPSWIQQATENVKARCQVYLGTDCGLSQYKIKLSKTAFASSDRKGTYYIPADFLVSTNPVEAASVEIAKVAFYVLSRRQMFEVRDRMEKEYGRDAVIGLDNFAYTLSGARQKQNIQLDFARFQKTLPASSFEGKRYITFRIHTNPAGYDQSQTEITPCGSSLAENLFEEVPACNVLNLDEVLNQRFLDDLYATGGALRQRAEKAPIVRDFLRTTVAGTISAATTWLIIKKFKIFGASRVAYFITSGVTYALSDTTLKVTTNGIEVTFLMGPHLKDDLEFVTALTEAVEQGFYQRKPLEQVQAAILKALEAHPSGVKLLSVSKQAPRLP